MDTTNVTVHAFLTNHPVGVLSTSSKYGDPWGSTIVFAVDEDLTFYFMTRAKTRKYQNISINPHVAITVTDAEQQITVQAAGKVEQVEAEDMMDVVFEKLDKVKPSGTHHWIAPVYKVHKGDYMILKCKPDSLHYADFGRAPSGDSDSYIEQII